jgi:hypothetical protein
MDIKKKLVLLLIVVLLAACYLSFGPIKNVEAGMMWWGKQPIVFIPPQYTTPRIVPTSIFTPAWMNPAWLQWNIGPVGMWYVGFARDTTTILPRNPIYTPVGAIGVWDPIPTMYLDDDIYYYEFFVGMSDDASNPFGWTATSLPLDYDISNNQIIGNHSGTIYNPDWITETTFNQVGSYVDSGSLPATFLALEGMTDLDRLVITRFTVELADVVIPTPEPCILFFISTGLMGLLVLRKKGKR